MAQGDAEGTAKLFGVSMQNIKISVITVCLNSEAFIGDALASVDAQTWPSIEHLIIDGGSTDATLSIVDRHKKSWRRVYSGADGGIYDAMNKGIAKATGDVIGFINADDFYPDCDVLALVAQTMSDQSVDACYGDLCYVRQGNTAEVVRYWQSRSFMPGSFAVGWVPPHPTLFVRRQIYDRLGCFDLSYRIAADMELMARFFEVHGMRAVYVNRVLVHMRLGGTTNRSVRNIVRQNLEIWRALRAHGLKPALWKFVVGKMLSRGRQFVVRPAK